MKLLTAISIFVMTIAKQTDFYATDMSKKENCFSQENFDIVYKYIDTQLKKSNLVFYEYGNYELYLNNTTEISFRDDGYTLSKVIKEKGVISLAKRKQDNDKISKKTNQLFCELLLLASKTN